jgi:flagellar biogenesis protein FliO
MARRRNNRVQPVLESAVAATKRFLGDLCNSLRRMRDQRGIRSLHVRETAPLGEKRFVALVDVDGERFLIGGAAGSVAVLATLRAQNAPGAHFSSVLHHFDCQGETIQ